MVKSNFYTPDEVRPLYGEVVSTYQESFIPPPWNEVSKCVDERLRCIGGLSAVAIGTMCDTCGLCPSRSAYEADELIERFDALGCSRPTAWYVEQTEQGLTLAAIAWRALPSDIAAEKYTDVPEMSGWMVERLGNKPVMWLDEVFANRQLKSRGNLRNFSEFVTGLATMLECKTVAYRTIEPRMTAAARRDFGDNAVILRRGAEAPDRRDFVIINNVVGAQ